jgi:hypothetical protein
LSHLTAIKQKYNEHVTNYIRRFRDTRNWYFNLNISDKGLIDLAYSGLSSYLKEKLEGHNFLMLAKEFRGFTRGNDKSRNDRHVNMVEYGSELLNDEEDDICVAEWNWGSKSKPFVYSALELVSKNRQDEMHFTFNVAKCDKIFNYLL